MATILHPRNEERKLFSERVSTERGLASCPHENHERFRERNRLSNREVIRLVGKDAIYKRVDVHIVQRGGVVELIVYHV